jgi:hypothetical protein
MNSQPMRWPGYRATIRAPRTAANIVLAVTTGQPISRFCIDGYAMASQV